MSVTLHIILPPQRAQQFTLEPRQTLVFGQGTEADVSLKADELLLPRHFSITHHQEFCQLTLLDVSGTLLLNNNRSRRYGYAIMTAFKPVKRYCR